MEITCFVFLCIAFVFNLNPLNLLTPSEYETRCRTSISCYTWCVMKHPFSLTRFYWCGLVWSSFIYNQLLFLDVTFVCLSYLVAPFTSLFPKMFFCCLQSYLWPAVSSLQVSHSIIRVYFFSISKRISSSRFSVKSPSLRCSHFLVEIVNQVCEDAVKGITWTLGSGFHLV